MMAKAASARPSDLVGIDDRWAAYQLDSAVTLVGTALENASQEMHEVNKRMVPKYTMAQLLDPAFRLPAPPSAAQEQQGGLAALKALARRVRGGVRVFKAKG